MKCEIPNGTILCHESRNRKAPQKRVLRGYSVPDRKKQLLLGSGFAGAHFEPFFTAVAALLLGAFFKLLSHSGESFYPKEPAPSIAFAKNWILEFRVLECPA